MLRVRLVWFTAAAVCFRAGACGLFLVVGFSEGFFWWGLMCCDRLFLLLPFASGCLSWPAGSFAACWLAGGLQREGVLCRWNAFRPAWGGVRVFVRVLILLLWQRTGTGDWSAVYPHGRLGRTFVEAVDERE